MGYTTEGDEVCTLTKRRVIKKLLTQLSRFVHLAEASLARFIDAKIKLGAVYIALISSHTVHSSRICFRSWGIVQLSMLSVVVTLTVPDQRKS